MMKTKISAIKKSALSVLKKCWAETAFISLLSGGIMCGVYILIILIGRLMGTHTAETVMPVFSSFSVPFTAIALFILTIAYIFYAPLYFGIRWYFWQAAGGQLMPLSSLFACYISRESVSRCIRLKFITDIRRFMFLVIFGGLAALEILLAARLWSYSEGSIMLRVLIVLGCAVAAAGLAVLYLVFTVKYMPVGYFLADNPYSSTAEILALSRRTVEKRYYQTMRFYLSFAKYVVLFLLVFPILFFQPVMCIFTAVLIRDGLHDADDRSESSDAAEVQPEEVPV